MNEVEIPVRRLEGWRLSACLLEALKEAEEGLVHLLGFGHPGGEREGRNGASLSVWRRADVVEQVRLRERVLG